MTGQKGNKTGTKEKARALSARFTESEIEAMQAKANEQGVSLYTFIHDRCVKEPSLTQLYLEIAEIRNVLANVLLGEKILSARMDSFFKSISTRMSEKDPKVMTREQRTEVEERTTRSFQKCVDEAVEKAFSNYAGGDDDPLYLMAFGERMEALEEG